MRHFTAFVLCVACAGTASAQVLPAGFLRRTITSALPQPTALAELPDGRLLITTQGGAVRVVKDGVLLAAPALTLPVASDGERGVIGVAIDPAFASNGTVYLHYTTPGSAGVNPFGRVSRFTMVGDTIPAASEVMLIAQLESTGISNHQGGALRIGPDGQLYVAVGENAVPNNSQVLTNRLGKILRIDRVTGAASAGNPFLGVAGAAPSIWAYGFRNPFKIDFSPDNGQLFINDVGQDTFEEIDLGAAGGNYGWPLAEGPDADPTRVSPLFAYDHTAGECAITGAAFNGASGNTFGAAYAGVYFFADFCSGSIYARSAGGSVATFAGALGFGPVDLLRAANGNLYYLRSNGELGVIAPDGDGDGVEDGDDNCAFFGNPNQADVGGIGAFAGPDGIGDACQCGDVNGDGRVLTNDATFIQRSLLAVPTASLARPDHCDVGGTPVGICNTADATIIKRALLAVPTATVQQVCSAALP